MARRKAESEGSTEAGDSEDMLMSVLDTVRTAVRNDPMRTLGMGVMVGIVAGSGLWAWMLRPLVATGARLAFATVVPSIISRFQVESDAEAASSTAS